MTTDIRETFASTYRDANHRRMDPGWRGRQGWIEVRKQLAMSIAYDVAYGVTPDSDEAEMFMRVDWMLSHRFARLGEDVAPDHTNPTTHEHCSGSNHEAQMGVPS